MAQRAEKEEAEFKVVPETTSLCVKCGGVAGNSPTNNLCQKCSNATTTASTSTAAAGATTSLGGARPLEHISFRSRSLPDSKPNLAETNRDLKKETSTTAGAAPPTRREVNRCSSCRRKVGLTVFRCRCGELFCADHRYSDRHDCSFDYKAAGREAISRENPVVKAAKIVKI